MTALAEAVNDGAPAEADGCLASKIPPYLSYAYPVHFTACETCRCTLNTPELVMVAQIVQQGGGQP